MSFIQSYSADSFLHQGILSILIVLIGIFFSLSLLFALGTVYLRFRNLQKEKFWRRLEAKWEERLLLILEGEAEPQTLWDQVRRKEGLYFVDFLFRYSQRLRGMEEEVLNQIAKPFLSPIAARLKGGDPEQRARAIITLSALGLEEYGDLIISYLDDPSPLVAMIAARSLARKDHLEFAPHIISHLHRFESWSRNYLTSLLKAIGPGGTPMFRKTLADPQETPLTRTIAAQALRELNDLPSAEIAADILQKEHDRELLAAALKLLMQIGSSKHVPIIREMTHHPDFVVRANAFRALGALCQKSDLEILSAGMEDAVPWVAIQAAHGLIQAGGHTVLQEIAQSHKSCAPLAQQVLAEATS